MNVSTAILTTPAASTNSTVYFSWLIRSNVDIAIFSINILFGLPTNSYIVWLIFTGTGSGIATEFFNLNHTICEIVYSLNCLCYLLSIAFPSVLAFALFFVGLGLIGLPLFECLICVERYVAVIHPIIFLKYKPLRYRVICSAGAWMFCFGCGVGFRFVLNSASFIKLTWLLSMQFFLFLSIQLFCCLAVLRALKQSGPGERGREREEENHMKKRAFILILITTVNMVVMFVPYIVTGILCVLQQDSPVCWSVSLCCFVLTAFVHPFLYLQRNGKLNFLKKLPFSFH